MIIEITVEIARDVRIVHRKNRGDAPVFGRNQMGTVEMRKVTVERPEDRGYILWKTVGMLGEAVIILLETVEIPLVLKKQFQNFREKQKKTPPRKTQERWC